MMSINPELFRSANVPLAFLPMRSGYDSMVEVLMPDITADGLATITIRPWLSYRLNVTQFWPELTTWAITSPA